jgi:hypothetical protein
MYENVQADDIKQVPATSSTNCSSLSDGWESVFAMVTMMMILLISRIVTSLYSFGLRSLSPTALMMCTVFLDHSIE